MTNSTPPNQAERLLASVGVILDRMLVQEPSEGGRPMRYNPLDYAILRMLEREPGCSGSDIARRLSAARTSVQSALDRLERAELIEKKPPQDGGRIRTLHLTREGTDMRARIHANDLVNMEALLAPLSHEEREAMLPLLGRVAQALNDSET